jgi:hypothetical protein
LFHNVTHPANTLTITTESGQLRLRLPAACVSVEADPKDTPVVRAETRRSGPDGGESVEVALFPTADDFLRQLLRWLRRREADGVHAARGGV